MSQNHKITYGQVDSSFIAAGGVQGIQQLVENFYEIMRSDERFKDIYAMHPKDTNISIDKLARFLCGWLGGPKRFQEKYGSISIPSIHSHLAIGITECDQWLNCMQIAIDKQNYDKEFKIYLIQQLSFPAEMIRKRCAEENT